MKAVFSLRFIAVSLCICIASNTFAQNQPSRQERCVTGSVMEKYFQKFPRDKTAFEKAQREFQQKYEAVRRAKKGLPVQQRLNAIVTIPVVVHIVMDNPALVTDEQVQSQLDVLNADYAGKNADSVNIPAPFKSLFGKGNIRFCLAQRSPSNEPSNGITRKISSATSVPGDNDPVKYASMGGVDAWDINRYLNIWVCKMKESNDLGYSFMPGLPGLASSDVGLVTAYHAFGTIGSAAAPFNKGRTATHEIGHFFNLSHIWGANQCVSSCSDSDFVDDTPNQDTCHYKTPVFPQKDACTSNEPGVMFMNFMDYVDDAAMCLFTTGQTDRMETALSTFTDRMQLMTSNGCVPPVLYNNDVKALAVVSPANAVVYCGTNIIPQLSIINLGDLPLTNIRLNVSVDGGIPVVTNLTLNLPSLGETTLSANAITATSGHHSVKLYTTLPNGTADQRPINDTATMLFSVIGDASTPLTQGFESATFPPQGWGIANNSDVVAYNPVRITNAAHSGATSVKFDNYNYQLFGKHSMLVTPQLKIPLNADSVKITFWRAAAQYSSMNSDTLEVLFSADCGQTFTPVYKKSGADLKTRADFTTTAYIPVAGEWVADTIDISALVKGRYDNIIVQFRNINGYGNNVYIDDINIYTRTLPQRLKEKGYLIAPNPTTGLLTIQHYPSSSTLRGVAVYSSTGQLVWKQRYTSSTAPNYIPVNLNYMASGIYVVQLVYTDKTITQKVVKMN
ncbi:M43 family zinc metalloprotease [Agriterribacter sp.]|uniref:M43 family zinc metalloprotease n=1 Tax=Agriterribacter sp. TaxID=2821509 RepID=UPI002D07DE2A|nr:M43 family zinc metalloprotease [Agriterribacter sp.]HTN06132.1 M43 family zinc metalloprotease [Agriterribacter sp.]